MLSNISEFSNSMNSLIEDGKKNILLDLQEVSYISAKGIGVIADFFRRIKEYNGDLKIIYALNPLKNIFDMCGLTKYMEFFTDEKDALASFGKHVGVNERLLLWSINKG